MRIRTLLPLFISISAATLAACGGDKEAPSNPSSGPVVTPTPPPSGSPPPAPAPAPAPAPTPTPGILPPPTITPTPPPAGVATVPPQSAALAWSDPATWGGTPPPAGAQVVIPPGRAILLDINTAALGGLHVQGALYFADRDVTLTAGWIMVNGLLQAGTEAQPFTRRATITLTGTNETADVMGFGTKFLGAIAGGRIEIHGHRRDALAFTQLAAHAAVGDTAITLKENVDWRVGDQIVLAPSGFNALEAEQLTITAIAGNRVSFTPALRYRHFGQTQLYEGRVLDSRAHVGLLTRDIVIQGAADSDASQFGGHVMMMSGGFARIAGVEFQRMGQMGHRARYPIHWHLVDRLASRGITGQGQYAIGNSIHGSFQRAIVMHGTSNLRAERNVAFDISNHAIVAAESGDEENNLVRSNLVVLTKAPTWEQSAFRPTVRFGGPDGAKTLQNEQKASAFWHRNTNNVFIDNVAAGSIDGNGFFFDGQFQVDPAEPATGDFFTVLDIAVQKPSRMTTFTGNIAYGHCTWDRQDNGTLISPTWPSVSIYQGATTAHGLLVQEAANVLHRQPNPAGDLVFTGFTTYKNCKSGVWLETGRELMTQSIIADSHAVFIPEKGPRVDGLLAIGRTANNIGGHSPYYTGFVWNDASAGSFRLTNSTFIDVRGVIVYTDDFAAGGGQVSGLRLINSLPFSASNDLRGSTTGFLLDADGSLTGRNVATRVSINPLSAQSSAIAAPVYGSATQTLNYYLTPQ